jgi:hypothetical protein
MNHGVSLKHVSNVAIQEAIAAKAHPDVIARLKASVAFTCVTGFEYHEVAFEDLANLLSHDVGFNNFKFKDVATATYDKTKHPEAYGRIRGVNNIESGCSWVWFDIDVTTISDTEMHEILSKFNHHIARTSDPAKAFKYRILIELSTNLVILRDEWKPFVKSIANMLGLGKIDNLAQSAVIYGYKGRSVLSQLNGEKLDPVYHLAIARAEVAKKLEEELLWDYDKDSATKLLANPYSTFGYAYDAQVGDRWKTSMAAIEHAKKLGASKAYIQDLMYAINDFLDTPKSRDIVRTSLFSAI